MPPFTVVDLKEDQFDAAYPLVRTIAPEVSPDRWLTYAKHAREKGGLLGLIGAENTLFGFLTYRRGETLRYGPVLHVDTFLTFEFNGAAPGRRALCEAVEARAREQGYAAVELRLESRGYADGSSMRAQGWLILGHRLDGVVFTKLLDGVADHPVDKQLALADSA